MRSLRFRITAVATILVAAVLTVAVLAVTALVDRQLRDHIARQNERTLDDLRSRVERGEDPATMTLPLGSDGTLFAVTTPDGRHVNSTLVVSVGEDGKPPEDSQQLDDLLGQPARAVTRSVRATAPDGTAYDISSTSPTTVVERSVASVRSVLWGALPVLTAVFAIIVWMITGRTLRPVSQMTARVRQITTDTLDERLDEPGTGDEIDRLAGTFNSMLARLDRSVAQQRRFVSDASHELRSPLTVIIGEAELAASSGDPDRIAKANAVVVEQGRMLTALIDDLLELARSGSAGLRHAEVDLDDLVREQARAQPIPIDTSAVVPVRVHGDAAALTRLTRNLLDNAVKYGGGRVAAATELAGTSAVLIIDDDGCGVPPRDRDSAFERFSRRDPARQRGTGGVGLGLAIVAAIVEAHEGTIEIGEAPLGGARFLVRLPTRS